MRASELVLAISLSACSANDDVPAPQVGSVTPDHAPAGSVVQISGDYFCQAPVTEDMPCDVTGTVQFGTIPGITTLWSETEIMVEVPQGLTMQVSLQVVAGGRRSNSVTFTPS